MPIEPRRTAGPFARMRMSPRWRSDRAELWRYIGWRLVQLAIVLIGVSAVVFFTMHVLPGDVAMLLLGDRGTAQQLAKLRLQLGLDQPIVVQYLRFVVAAAHGDFGTSLTSNRAAFTDVSTAFPVTLQLTLAALTLATFIGVPAGVFASLRPGGTFDNLAMTFTLFGVSMPIFWLGLMLLLLFGATLDWLPIGGLSEVGMEPPRITGMSLIDAALAGSPSMFWDALRHLILPACTLATVPLAFIARITRAEMMATATQDHVRTARAKGLPRARVILRHVLRNALIPIVTVIGLQLGLLLSGAVLTETIFSLPGLGRLMVDSILSRDYPVVQAGALFIAFVFVLVNLLVDLSYTLLDPRIRRA
jgi:peptide/nickel transport system permease protein